ncbi:MAG: TetR family transcriptional regulator [Streptosporangiales bacterium]|nr:TetR family transcriptional regulator [Streptosporangiales bacterium]
MSGNDEAGGAPPGSGAARGRGAEGGTARRIAAAAREILTDEGADAVSMRRVAEAVGVTPMAIYRHYPNRGALLRSVADETLQELADRWRANVTTSGFEERLDGLLAEFLDFALGHPHLYGFLMTDRWERARRFPEDYADSGPPAFAEVTELVRQAMGEGELREDDPLEVALTVTSHPQGLVQLYLAGRIGLPEPEFRALCHRSTWRVVNGIRA